MLTGRFDKLKKLEELLKKEGDNSRRFTNSLFTCNIEEKIRLLMQTGHCNKSINLIKNLSSFLYFFRIFLKQLYEINPQKI